MNKFEKLIEYIINDEDQKARELFHSIVVEKSRDIYESIMDEESMEETVAGPQVEDMVDEISNDESHAMEADEEEGEDEQEFDLDQEQDDEVAGDFADDSGEEHNEIEDKVMNIDAKLDELLAKFDEIMGDDDMGAEEPAMDMGNEMGAEEQPEEGMYEAAGSGKSGSAMSGKSGKSGSAKELEEGENPFAKSGKSGKSGSGSAASGKSGKSGKGSAELMREYVDKIQDMNLTGASEGDAVGAAGKKVAVNTKPGSIGPGNNFGGTAVSAKGGEQNQDGTRPASAPKPQDIKSGNRNVPGGKADSLESTGKEYSKASDAEGQTTDGKVAVATKSVQTQNTGKK